MKITGITCCCGEKHLACFREFCSTWSCTLDELIIMTQPGDPTALEFPQAIQTNAFTRYGASFNKGAALALAVQVAQPTDWVLSFDCDVLPPDTWRDFTSRLPEHGLYGAPRRDEETMITIEPIATPLGYFQLWHRSSRPIDRPVYDVGYLHAGSYDMRFIEAYSYKKMLDFRLLHRGERRQHWFGSGSGDHRMQELRKHGLHLARHMRLLADDVARLTEDTMKCRVN